MKLMVHWKAGILWALIVAVIGTMFAIVVGSKIDFQCKNTTPHSAGCRVHNSANVVIQGYTDIWRALFAPRCVGGNGPDDCIGPDATIMLVTLLVIGFVCGALIWRKKVEKDERTKLGK